MLYESRLEWWVGYVAGGVVEGEGEGPCLLACTGPALALPSPSLLPVLLPVAPYRYRLASPAAARPAPPPSTAPCAACPPASSLSLALGATWLHVAGGQGGEEVFRNPTWLSVPTIIQAG